MPFFFDLAHFWGYVPLYRCMAQMIGNLPVFRAIMEDDCDGVRLVSLVDDPAIERNFITLSADRVVVQLADEARRLVTGPLLIPDFPIYRRHPQLGEFYMVWDKETIEEVARQMFRDNSRFVNIMHEEGIVTGIEMQELYIKDSSRSISPQTFDDVPDGALFVTYHVTNDGLWQMVTDGTFKGFSLEGVFALDLTRDEALKMWNIVKNIQ